MNSFFEMLIPTVVVVLLRGLSLWGLVVIVQAWWIPQVPSLGFGEATIIATILGGFIELSTLNFRREN